MEKERSSGEKAIIASAYLARQTLLRLGFDPDSIRPDWLGQLDAWHVAAWYYPGQRPTFYRELKASWAILAYMGFETDSVPFRIPGA